MFSGGKWELERGESRAFLSATRWRFSGKIESATNFTGNFLYLRALMAVLDNLGFLSWLHQDGHLS